MRLKALVCLLVVTAAVYASDFPPNGGIRYSPGGGSSTSLARYLSRYWPMEETGTNDRVDVIAGKHLVAVGTTSAAAGKNNNGVVFNANDEGLTISVVDFFPSTSFTVAYWVNPTAFNDSGFGAPVPGAPMLTSSAATIGFDAIVTGGGAGSAFNIYPWSTSGKVASGPAMATGSFQCVVLTYDAATKTPTMRVDGTTVTGTAGTTPMSISSGTMKLGCVSTDCTQGTYDELAVWGIVLTTAQQDSYCTGRYYPY